MDDKFTLVCDKLFLTTKRKIWVVMCKVCLNLYEFCNISIAHLFPDYQNFYDIILFTLPPRLY
jgi:hypothetical protein